MTITCGLTAYRDRDQLSDLRDYRMNTIPPCDFRWYFNSTLCRIFFMKYYTTVKQQTIHCDAKFGWNIGLWEMTKLCCFNQDNTLPISQLFSVMQNYWKQTGSLTRMSGPLQALQIWTRKVSRPGRHPIEKYHKLQPKSRRTHNVKVVLQTISEEFLPQEHINNAVANFTKCLTLTAYMAVFGWR